MLIKYNNEIIMDHTSVTEQYKQVRKKYFHLLCFNFHFVLYLRNGSEQRTKKELPRKYKNAHESPDKQLCYQCIAYHVLN
jgi:hypothetical protein